MILSDLERRDTRGQIFQTNLLKLVPSDLGRPNSAGNICGEGGVFRQWSSLLIYNGNVTCDNILENASEVREIAAVGLLQQVRQRTYFCITKLSYAQPLNSKLQPRNLSLILQYIVFRGKVATKNVNTTIMLRFFCTPLPIMCENILYCMLLAEVSTSAGFPHGCCLFDSAQKSF